jgi:hypothetical protein
MVGNIFEQNFKKISKIFQKKSSKQNVNFFQKYQKNNFEKRFSENVSNI